MCKRLRSLNFTLSSAKGNCEMGRSMVEMLGVLAVVGFLSITGIRAYTIAMAKLKANEAAQNVGIAHIVLETAAVSSGQASTSLDLPKDSYVSLKGTNDYKNAGIKVDFGGNVDACKQFAMMYQNNSNFEIKYDCTE